MKDQIAICPKCQTENATDNAFCFKCGQPLREAAVPAGGPPPAGTAAPPEAFRWSWVGWSALIIFGTAVGLAVVVGFAYGLITRSDVMPFWLVAAANIGGMFLGGMLAGYKSPGVTIKEPAVAAAIVTVLSVVASKQYSAILVGWILPYALAYIGAWLGEKIQGTV